MLKNEYRTFFLPHPVRHQKVKVVASQFQFVSTVFEAFCGSNYVEGSIPMQYHVIGVSLTQKTAGEANLTKNFLGMKKIFTLRIIGPSNGGA